jgi:hypothetical protein
VILEAKMGENKAAAHWSFTLSEAAVKAKDQPVATPKK